MTTTEIIVTESRELHQLTAHMQRHVDRTLAADRKGGEALWEKALAVADARAEAKHGDWQAYLDATGLDERAARRLMGIAERGRSEGRFREAIISGWLSFSVAAIAAKADDELLRGLLDQPKPPTYAQITASANPATLPDLKPARPATPVVVAPASNKESDFARLQSASDIYKLSAVADALRKDDIKAASAVTGTIQDLDNRQRANVAIYARIGGKSIASVVAMLEAPTVPTAPALSAFPPGHVEAGIGALERRLTSGTPHIAEDIPWAEQLRTQLDDARAGMQPEVYGTWSARLHSVRAALGVLESQQRKPIIEAPQAAPVKKTTSQAVLLEYAESMLAGVVEGIPDTAIHLVAALVCWEYEPYSGDDPREALFQTLKILAKDNLDVVDTAIQWQKGI